MPGNGNPGAPFERMDLVATWETETVLVGTPAQERLLGEGWEPFAVQTAAGGAVLLWLRRTVWR